MKITQGPVNGLPDLGAPASVGDAPEGQAASRQRPGDRVELSQAARLRAQLRSEIGDLGEIPAQQVQALRAEIAAGTYHRDPLAVAERFLADVAGELLS